MPTLKQDRLVEGVINPRNITKPLCDIAKEAGYSDSVSTSQVYKDIRKTQIAQRIANAFSEERIKRDILKAEKDFAKDKDNSNRARMLELRAKIKGLTKDTAITNVITQAQKLEADLNKPKSEQAVNNSLPVDNCLDVSSSNSKG